MPATISPLNVSGLPSIRRVAPGLANVDGVQRQLPKAAIVSISPLTQRLFNYLNSESGNVHLFLFEDLGGTTAYLSMYDPKYHDLNAVQVSCDISNYTGDKYPLNTM